ncbi:MAG TPA: alpha-1,2-fucosyltransferase [Verrucomicrobiae bacterium]|nr:alpha-1,2-fucosyltransferase [Verrucomicrobiae bacterium]
MIVAKLMGGLGNQMFQYALGRHLALKHGVPLKVDLDFLLRESRSVPDTTPHDYNLPHFHVAAEPSTVAETSVLKLPVARGWRRQLRRVQQMLAPGSLTHVLERGLAFDPRVLRAGPDVYLEGYWQSPRYFEPVAAQIRADFELRDGPDGRNAALLLDIADSEAVAVHVRRGDYITSPGAARVHGLCGLDYYEAALAEIARRVRVPRFFLFSDDPAWVQANLRVPGTATMITHNGPRPWEDLRLMRACRHFVIANSSFSWWGAWLSAAPGKIVIAPRRWALESGLNVATRHPPEWQTL